MKNRYSYFFLLVIIHIGFFNLFSCGSDSSVIDKKSLDKLIIKETSRSQRYDSIVYGVKLGMSSDDFFYYVDKAYREGLFYPSRGNTMVKIEFNKGFDHPVNFEFFPANAKSKFTPLKQFKAGISYINYSIYNQEMTLSKLLKQSIQFFENGYKGNKFLKVPNNKDIFIKYNYVKIDGNRLILIKPSSTFNELNIIFEDLKPKIVTKKQKNLIK